MKEVHRNKWAVLALLAIAIAAIAEAAPSETSETSEAPEAAADFRSTAEERVNYNGAQLWRIPFDKQDERNAVADLQNIFGKKCARSTYEYKVPRKVGQ